MFLLVVPFHLLSLSHQDMMSLEQLKVGKFSVIFLLLALKQQWQQFNVKERT